MAFQMKSSSIPELLQKYQTRRGSGGPPLRLRQFHSCEGPGRARRQRRHSVLRVDVRYAYFALAHVLALDCAQSRGRPLLWPGVTLTEGAAMARQSRMLPRGRSLSLLHGSKRLAHFAGRQPNHFKKKTETNQSQRTDKPGRSASPFLAPDTECPRLSLRPKHMKNLGPSRWFWTIRKE